MIWANPRDVILHMPDQVTIIIICFYIPFFSCYSDFLNFFGL